MHRVVIDRLKRLLLNRKRRRLAGQDVAIYASTSDPELDAWVAWSSAHPPKLDD